MKKRLYPNILIAAFVFCSIFALFSACGNNDGKQTVDEINIVCSADGNSTKLSWTPIKGVKFSVYRAKSRFSNYELVKDNITDGNFSDDTRYAYYKVEAYDKSGKMLRAFDTVGEELDLFGENVYVFSPHDSFVAVNKIINEIYDEQYDSEFSSQRYAFYFKQGVYDERIILKQSYYTTFAGLGISPSDVSIRSLQSVNGANGNALINFWRGTENMSLGSVKWAVSQGAYLRRVNVNGSLTLHDNGGFASGGFLADSYIKGTVESGSQQQWLSRNCEWGGWSGNVWNMCFLGVNGAPQGEYPEYKYTSVETTPVIREKPFLTFTESGYKIAVPHERINASGCSWKNTDTEISYMDFDDVYVAEPQSDTAQTINDALKNGKHILFTSGIYELSEPITVQRDNTVLLGTGLATLTPIGGNACLRIKSGKGVTVAGLLFDAGEIKSRSLFDAGTDDGDASNVYVFDCFFRVGGATQADTAADTCVNVYADGTVFDNIWAWRADHGNGVGWDVNCCDTGVAVYADNVTAYGLFSEHFKKNNVLWCGENGNVVFYQSEIAYDVPAQSVWTDGDRLGYASFKVDNAVENFTAYGLGIYSNFHNDGIILESAMQVPDSVGVSLKHICSVALSSKGIIRNVVNGTGGAVGGGESARYLVEYSFVGK